MQKKVPNSVLKRLPVYLAYLKSLPEDAPEHISATSLAMALNMGEVQVRKDLGALSRTGRPRIGYLIGELLACMEKILSAENGNTVIVGAGKLGKALLDYGGFAEYGISILAAFDKKITKKEYTGEGKLLLPVEELSGFCLKNKVKIGVIAVPAEAAQEICDLFYENGIKVMWCFSPCQLHVPSDAVIQYENMALSLAHLKTQRKT